MRSARVRRRRAQPNVTSASSTSADGIEHLPGTRLVGADDLEVFTVAGLGAPELLIVLAVVLVLFGGAKLPKLARSLGEAKREFEHSTRGSDDDASSVA
jgi:sec-independent protein translocase protein TatA